MAFAVGEICKGIVMVAANHAPYLTEGVTKIDQSQIAGKRVGQTYKFDFNKAEIGVSHNGMKTWGDNTGEPSSVTEEITIWNSSAKVANTALAKKLTQDDWDGFVKQTGVDIVDAMVKDVATADLGKAGEAIVVTDVSKIPSKSLVMNKYGQTVRAYGSYNAIGAIMSCPKINAPLLSKDNYDGLGKVWSFANFKTMRPIDLPTLVCDGDTTVTSVTVGSDGKVSAIAGTLGTSTVGKCVKLAQDGSLICYFPNSTATDGIVIGAKPSSEETYTVVTSSDSYEPVIMRADGAQCAVEASGLIEASDSTANEGGIGIAHTEIKNAGRGLDHYWDIAGAYGVGRREAVKVLLLQC